MLLKRIYDQSGDEPVLDHIKVLKSTKRQNFTQKLINRGVEEGWLSMGQGKITLHTVPELNYRVVRAPGFYCCFDDAKLDDDKHGDRYVAENYAGQTSPDKNNPAGYRKDNFFACELIEGESNG